MRMRLRTGKDQVVATREIPAIEIRICDACGVETQDFGMHSTHRRQVVVSVEGSEFCYMGDSQGRHTRKFDLCDACASKVNDIMLLKHKAAATERSQEL